MKKLLPILLLIFSNSVYSWSITPMSKSLALNENNFILKINNTGGNEMIALKLSVFNRTQNPEGDTDILTKTNDIRIFPSQIIIPAGKIKPIRVLIKQKNNTNFEKAYRLIAETVPIKKNDSQESGIQVFLKYIASIYLKPTQKIDNGKKLTLNNAKIIGDNLILNIVNTNAYHKILTINQINSQYNGRDFLVDNKDVMHNILANSNVNIKIKLSEKQKSVLINNTNLSFVNECKVCDKSHIYSTSVN